MSTITSRRQFIGSLASAGAGVLLGAGTSGAQTRAAAAGRIDVHHHFASPAWTKILTGQNILAAPWRNWTPQRAIEEMDRSGTAVSLLSITTPGVWFGDRGFGNDDDARRLARETNDHGAKLVAGHKGRFGLFAALPLPHIDNSLREIEYGLDTLKADGICLMTSYGGRWLGDPAFTPILQELNRRRAVVYVHPTTAPCCRDLIPNVDEATIEYQTDTSRTLASLLVSGAASRHPDVHFIFSHAGGTMPFLVYRFDRPMLGGPESKKTMPNGPMYELRRFYYDTAQSANFPSMAGLAKVVPVSQIVFGTDYPYHTITAHVEGIRDTGVFTAEQLRAIDRDNLARILPRFRTGA